MEPTMHRNAHATLGILYAEDFGLAAVPDPPPPMPAPGLAQADLDAACICAVQAAQTAWASSAAERRAEALAAIAAALTQAGKEAAEHAETIADGIARTALAMVAGLLPRLCQAHGDAEVRAIVGRLAPLLARNETLTLRVHPSLVDTLAQDLATLDDTLRIDLRAANLPPGDIRMSWDNGTLVRDTAAIGAAMQDALDLIGLDPLAASAPDGVLTQTGSLACAQ